MDQNVPTALPLPHRWHRLFLLRCFRWESKTPSNFVGFEGYSTVVHMNWKNFSAISKFSVGWVAHDDITRSSWNPRLYWTFLRRKVLLMRSFYKIQQDRISLWWIRCSQSSLWWEFQLGWVHCDALCASSSDPWITTRLSWNDIVDVSEIRLSSWSLKNTNFCCRALRLTDG